MAYCYIYGMSKAKKTDMEKGAALFESYLDAKKALTEKIKEVLDIMARCNVLDVTPPEATNDVIRTINDVANHQWRYNAGHETIYCHHPYSFHNGRYKYTVNKYTVKIPVAYLGMTSDKLYEVNKDAAIASLEREKLELDQTLANYAEPINKKKAKLDEKIAALRKGATQGEA